MNHIYIIKYTNIIYRNQPRLCAEAWRHGNDLAVGAANRKPSSCTLLLL